jgi:hypothetical protein
VLSSNTRQTLFALDGHSRQTLFINRNLYFLIKQLIDIDVLTLWTEISNITLSTRKLRKEINNLYLNGNSQNLPLERQANLARPGGHHFLYHL